MRLAAHFTFTCPSGVLLEQVALRIRGGKREEIYPDDKGRFVLELEAQSDDTIDDCCEMIATFATEVRAYMP